MIGRIIKGGIADKSHLLREGDELIEANGHDLRGRSVAEVCDILVSLFFNQLYRCCVVVFLIDIVIFGLMWFYLFYSQAIQDYEMKI